MSTIHELRGFQRDLLFVISGLVEPSGQAVRSELETAFEKEVRQGRLYSNLNDLVDEGLVEKTQQNGRTNRYTLTDAGRRVLKSRHDWERQYLEAMRST